MSIIMRQASLSTILIINAGSSSLKLAVYTYGQTLQRDLAIELTGIHSNRGNLSAHDANNDQIHQQTFEREETPTTLRYATKLCFDLLNTLRPGFKPNVVGHRVVHGGLAFDVPTRIDQAVINKLSELIPLAPMHQRTCLETISSAQSAFPNTIHVACFDTSFHRSKPRINDEYALPPEYYESGIRKFGFHGLSYEFVTEQLAIQFPQIAAGRCIIAHLGSGSSICAIKHGKSVSTSMGFTPLEGIPMGTRCGDIDPGVLLYWLQEKQMDNSQIAELLYQRSGLLGMSGVSSDIRELTSSSTSESKYAIEFFTQRVANAVSEHATNIGGVDSIVFTGGIGENDSSIRQMIISHLGWIDAELDEAKNKDATRTSHVISSPSSKVAVLIVPTNEQLMIAKHAIPFLEN